MSWCTFRSWADIEQPCQVTMGRWSHQGPQWSRWSDWLRIGGGGGEESYIHSEVLKTHWEWVCSSRTSLASTLPSSTTEHVKKSAMQDTLEL
jgi:hypothetical protein